MKHLIVKIKNEEKLVLAKFRNWNTARKVFVAMNVRKHHQEIKLLRFMQGKYYEANTSNIIQ